MTVDKIESAKNVIIQSLQRDHFHKEIDHLQRHKIIDKNVLTGLNLVVFEGVLRMGGRLDKDYHERVGHVGMSHTWATTRQKFWIVKGVATIRNVLGQCLLCKRRRNARAVQQIMSDLPTSRLTANKPPFYVTGVDYFGPMFVKQGRAMMKRWGCLFTCMTVRTVHIELVSSLSADSFINALRRRASQIDSTGGTFMDSYGLHHNVTFCLFIVYRYVCCLFKTCSWV